MCVRRSEARWRSKEFWGEGERVLEAVVYELDGKPEGCILYRQQNSGEEPPRFVDVREFVAVTREAWAGLISFLASYNPDDFSVRISTSRGEPLHPFLGDSHVEASIQPGLMLRLVDVEGALNLLNREILGPLVLDITDDAIPQNAGEYTVGGGEVVRGAEAEERISLDVRGLAQLYAGYLPARELARHGLIEASSEGALESLETLFPVGDPWVFGLDHF
jgi:predicted acetyltransferase